MICSVSDHEAAPPEQSTLASSTDRRLPWWGRPSPWLWGLMILLAIAAAQALRISPLFSTGAHHASSITLTYWYTESPAEYPVINNLISEFEQLNHDEIKINAVQKPFSQMRDGFITAAQDGEAPDVLRSDVGLVTLFASRGYLLNIDSRISQLDPSDYLSLKSPGGSKLSPLGYDEYQGHLYGLPQVTDCLALLYNKAKLASAGITHPPVTMVEFQHDAVKVVQHKAATYGFETSGTSYYALPFLYAYGGGMFDQHNNILVDSAGSVNGLQFLLNLEHNTAQVMPPTVDFSNGVNNMVTDFMSGRVAMIFDGPSDVSRILNGSGFKGNPSNLGITDIPSGPAGQAGSPLGGQSYVISARTAYPAEAYKFISFMSSTASQLAIAEANHTLPTRQSAYQGRVSSDRFISAFRHVWETESVARPAIPQNGYLFDVFDPNIWAALVGAQSPNDALKVVADSWSQLGLGSKFLESPR
jgi:arabinogalactan oligomer / maltooligosaccharide transport system substrate-binding protein